MPPSELERALAEAESHFIARHPMSARRQRNAARHLPGGNTRTVLHYSPFPLTWASGKGNRLTDIDGLVYLDLLGEYSAGLYGHSNPIIQAAMRQAIDDGLALGGPNVYEARLADEICARFASMDLVRFTNSGTEANLMALSVARAVAPGRNRVMVFEGGYHGGVFYFRRGNAQLNAPFDWLIGEYNDIEGSREMLRAHAASIAAVIVEPMLGGGCIAGTAEFLGMLRAECTAHDIILIFDEVMTSRLSPAGLQGLLGIRPDMTTLGKYLGGGASFGAFGGRRDIMQRLDPARPDSFSHAGTFNNNVLSMAGGLAGLTQVFTTDEVTRINALGDGLRAQLNIAAVSRGAPFQATGVGSLIGLHFADCETQETIENLFHLEMIERGFYFARRGYIALSLPTTEEDCDAFASAVGEFLSLRGSLIPRDHRQDKLRRVL
jgi:glutamate-1-semialdehyde 2,1-aminomutase